jgi:Tfp pilus assembly protein PilO
MMALEGARVRMGGILLVFLALDVAAVLFLFSPEGRSYGQWQKQRAFAQTQLQEERREAAPLLNIEKRMAQSRSDAERFMKARFVEKDSEVSALLQTLAKDQKVKIEKISYKEDATELEQVSALSLDTSVTGDYGSVVRFINAMERAKTAFVLESVSVGDADNGQVKLHLRMKTYLKRAQA